MSLYEKLISGREKLSVTGLGYVGMPVAVSFARKVSVIGFDINKEKIRQYREGKDPTREVGGEAVKASGVDFTADESRLAEAKFHIIAVPTPVKSDHTPDLGPVTEASRILGRNLTKGSIVVYESTVYPGVTEEVCRPVLEETSGLVCGRDFKIGYSPERINPGDKTHRLENIIKIVSGMDEETLDEIAGVYSLVARAGVYRAENIMVAEAAKVIENSQRDINIAFMNELSIIFNKMGIDTVSVLKAARTKWNFLDFRPGLVGGHCIGVDPYYLTYRAEQTGYHSQVILAGRRINDEMGRIVAMNVVKNLIRAGIPVKSSKVAILGFAFKEDCPDTRNTRVIDIVTELREYGIDPVIADPVADREEAARLYGVALSEPDEVTMCDAVIIAVCHEAYRRLDPGRMRQFYRTGRHSPGVLADVKGIFDRKEAEKEGFLYWRL